MRSLTSFFILLVLSSPVFAQPGPLDQALKQRRIPGIGGPSPTNGQVLTWDSTLGKAKWAAGGGGGGSFDPEAATNLTFADSNGRITGPGNQNLVLVCPDATGNHDGKDINISAGNGGGTGGSGGYGGYVYLYGGNGGSVSGGVSISAGSCDDGSIGDLVFTIPSAAGTNNSSGTMRFILGDKTGSGTPATFQVLNASSDTLFSISYDGTITGPTDVHTHLKSSPGTSLYLETSHETATDERSGDVNIRSGATDDGDTGYIILQVPTPGGTDRSANNIQLYLGAATGSGTPSSFQIYDGSASLLLEVNQDGTLYGPTGKAFEIKTASSQSLHFTSSNQMLFNDAGHYIRMGIGWMNLPSDGGIHWCSETTASTPEAMMFRAGTREYRLASDINADDTDRPIKFSIKSCDGPNLNCGIDLYSNGGTGTISQNYGGAYGGSSTLNLAAGGNTVTVDVTGLTTAIGRIVVGTSGPRIVAGDDSPESAVTAPVGSIYLRKNGGSGTTFYVKESGSGNTGWVAK